MKHLFWILTITFLSSSCEKGIYFGKRFDRKEPVSPDELLSKLQQDTITPELTIKGEIEYVCQSKGCWFAYNTTQTQIIRVLIKDNAFLIPQDIRLKTATCYGRGKIKKMSPTDLEEFAKDMGLPDSTSNTGVLPISNIIFEASGIYLE